MTRPPAPPDGSVLVRVRSADRGWARRLPRVPDGLVLTVTVGDPSLLPVPVDDLVSGGYRVVGVAPHDPPLGRHVDVLVPAHVRTAHPAWWRSLLVLAERAFDLRLGPVRSVLAAELELHLASLTR